MNKQIFDPFRKGWVKATPEEVVRQNILQRMTLQLGYPKELIAVEKKLKELPHLFSAKVPDRRIDILCYAKSQDLAYPIQPLLLMECKAMLATEEAMDQIIGYNYYVGAQFIAVVGHEQIKFRYFDPSKNSFLICSFLPSFKELLQWLK